jgi:glycosyltransferase involved in cell wall biosynthesis
MRILLTANASYAPPRGGATRSNMIWLDWLARAGHSCRVVAGPSKPGAEFLHHASIQVISVDEPAARVHTLGREIREFAPDWVLVSSEDLGHGLLREAHRAAPDRLVYLAHTPQFFPFGPASWNPDRRARAIVADSAGIVAIGAHMADYVERVLGRKPTVIHPPIYGAGPWPVHASFDRGFVTMINPCAVKGISLFVDIAARMTDCRFAVVPGWGTTAEDRRALECLPNVSFLPNARDIDDLLAPTRILLAPSLWYEGFGLIVMEALLRGIPVVASDSGGLCDSKQGTGYVLPVRLIERYQAAYDELAMPRPVVPANDPAPWVAAVGELLTRRDIYQAESARSRAAADRFVAGLDGGSLARFLEGLVRRGHRHGERGSIETLSPEKRALLLERLRQRKK